MNQQAFELGKSAYDQGDWFVAISQFDVAKEPGEVNGQIDHLLGNAYMKLGQFDSAASAYKSALADASYGKVGALSTNQGRALLAAGSAGVGALFLAQEAVLELVHPRVSEQQGWVIAWDQGAGGYTGVTLLFEEAKEGFTDFCAFH